MSSGCWLEMKGFLWNLLAFLAGAGARVEGDPIFTPEDFLLGCRALTGAGTGVTEGCWARTELRHTCMTVTRRESLSTWDLLLSFSAL